MSEIEMWLFDHAVNESRRRREAPAISGLWLWGGGAADEQLPAVDGMDGGKRSAVRGLCRASALSGEPGSGVSAGSGVVVIAEWPGSPAWREAEEALARAGGRGPALGAREATRFVRGRSML